MLDKAQLFIFCNIQVQGSRLVEILPGQRATVSC